MKTFPVRWLIGLLMATLFVSGCYGSTRPVVKIGLIAPFEELCRDDGYEVLNAVKLAVQERNAAGGVAGRDVALVALNDNRRGRMRLASRPLSWLSMLMCWASSDRSRLAVQPLDRR